MPINRFKFKRENMPTVESYDVYDTSKSNTYICVPVGVNPEDVVPEKILAPLKPIKFRKKVKNSPGLIGAPSPEEIERAFASDGYLICSAKIDIQWSFDGKPIT